MLGGQVLTVGAFVNVSYGAGRNAVFINQILCTPISQPSDSGSLVLDSDKKAVGLLFARSSSITIFNDINTVLSALNVSIASFQPR